MKTFASLTLSLFACLVSVTSVHAECYGDAAAAYGCGVPANAAGDRSGRASPSLEAFGSSEGPILPDTGYNNAGSSTDDIITPEERRRMMRNIILGRGGPSRSTNAQIQAVTSASRPVRRSGSMPARTR